MKKLLIHVGTTLGSSLGWWLGDAGSIMTNCILNIISLDIGMYVGAPLARRFDA